MDRRGARHRSREGSARSSWRALGLGAATATALVAGCVLVVALATGDRDGELASPSGGGRTTPPAATSTRWTGVSSARWTGVMQTLLDRRSAVWRDGGAAGLTDVFVAGSPAWSRDRRTLGAYAARGLRVRGLHAEVGQVDVMRVTRRTVRLEVVDRLARTVAVDRRGGRHRLPRDRPSRHAVMLALTPDGWRIASVRAL